MYMHIEHSAMRRSYAQKQKEAASLNAFRLFIQKPLPADNFRRNRTKVRPNKCI